MTQNRDRHAGRIGWLVVVFVFAFAACQRNEYAPPPPPRVTVAKPVVQTVTVFVEYTGTTQAVESVEIRARVKGFLVSMDFVAGHTVEKDSLLFVIDPQPFEVALKAAEAELQSNRAELSLAKTEYERTEQMYKRKATSEFNVVKTRANYEKARAAVTASEANVESARLDLDYAHVKAPFTGRVGRHRVDIGNLVGAGEATLLTEMVRYDPIYVYFHISERDLLALQKLGRERRARDGVQRDARPERVIEVGRADDEGYPLSGVIDFTANEVDSATGTFEVRGVLANRGAEDSIVIPGTFVRVRVPIDEVAESMLVTERALGSDQGGRYLLVVDDEGNVEHRSVEVGQIIDGMRVIRSGISPDDWVIVNGLQRARPGSKVEVERTVAKAPAPQRPPPPLPAPVEQLEAEGETDAASNPMAEAPFEAVRDAEATPEPDAAPSTGSDANGM